MERWHIVRTPLFRIYLHLFHHDDDDRALHDHPWASVSVSLRGRLREIYADGNDPRDQAACARRLILPGAIIWRPATFAHRLLLISPSALTLFVTGPPCRRWGFWCPRGWRHWKEYVNVVSPGEIGRGCE